MNFLELVKIRQSDREYDISRPVEQEKLDYIFETVRLAPSACNAQPWKFIVVTDPELRKQTAAAIADKTLGMNHFTFQAPVLIIVVEEDSNFTSKLGGFVKQKHFPDTDLGIATAHLTLAAAEQGLGTCILGWFDEKKSASCLIYHPLSAPCLPSPLVTPRRPTGKRKGKTIRKLSHIMAIANNPKLN